MTHFIASLTQCLFCISSNSIVYEVTNNYLLNHILAFCTKIKQKKKNRNAKWNVFTVEFHFCKCSFKATATVEAEMMELVELNLCGRSQWSLPNKSSLITISLHSCLFFIKQNKLFQFDLNVTLIKYIFSYLERKFWGFLYLIKINIFNFNFPNFLKLSFSPSLISIVSQFYYFGGKKLNRCV